MAVFRVERTQGYTVMSNYHLRDKSLSLKAKGLLSQMLSLPEDWDYTLSGLAVINRESKDAIRSAVNELEKAGYIKRRQTTDAGGKFSANEYMLNQASGDRQILARQLGISPHQLSYVTHSGEGEGLLFYGNIILPFIDRFPKDTELYRIMTTKLQELKEGKQS